MNMIRRKTIATANTSTGIAIPNFSWIGPKVPPKSMSSRAVKYDAARKALIGATVNQPSQ
jgi:hypothetical protein